MPKMAAQGLPGKPDEVESPDNLPPRRSGLATVAAPRALMPESAALPRKHLLGGDDPDVPGGDAEAELLDDLVLVEHVLGLVGVVGDG